jgi:hypothetical protein
MQFAEPFQHTCFQDRNHFAVFRLAKGLHLASVTIHQLNGLGLTWCWRNLQLMCYIYIYTPAREIMWVLVTFNYYVSILLHVDVSVSMYMCVCVNGSILVRKPTSMEVWKYNGVFQIFLVVGFNDVKLLVGKSPNLMPIFPKRWTGCPQS